MNTWHLVGYLLTLVAGAAAGVLWSRRMLAPPLARYLQRHFGSTALSTLAVTERQFAGRLRVDLQQALDRYLQDHAKIDETFGIFMNDANMFGMSLSALMTNDKTAGAVPLQYDEFDVGEDAPVRCLGNTMWLLHGGQNRYAVLLSKVFDFRTPAKIRIDVAAPNNPQAAEFTRGLYDALETAARTASSYRGKVLSMESTEAYTGQATGITVHRLQPVAREDVILPAATLDLLERNVLSFVKQRPALARLGQSARKGLLFHGPPGNGKTHTIHYLIHELAEHTTLLISAEQVGELAEYMALARLLQPSIVVLEDVDLIARDRDYSGSPCQESLLNKLLNEMDGLKADAEIMFILTTNRPEALEDALAARPGRVDQAIEFPSPDAAGREKLARLYAGTVELPAEALRMIVDRTEGVSAAFIKELMRRALQFHLEQTGEPGMETADVINALDELITTSGRLNRRLLGFSEAQPRLRDLHSISAQQQGETPR